MRRRAIGNYIRVAIIVFFSLALASRGFAQAGTGTLRGQITDPSKAAVVGARVLLTTPDGKSLGAETDRDGLYEIKNLAPGKYVVKVIAKGFAMYEKDDVAIAANQIQKLDVAMTIEEQTTKVVVTDTPVTVDVAPESNATAIVMTGKDLEMLSDDPDELQSDLEALAGPSAGPNGGQFYIDGFTAGQLPPKSSIREIRINQNPFSSEFDKLGYGRIEIFTKPGTDTWHGQLYLSGNSSDFNSRNPFVTEEPGYESTQVSASVGGPMSKKSSFFFQFERRDINDTSVVSAFILDPSFNPIPFNDAVPNPRTRMNFGPRVDLQIGKNNYLTVRYQYWRNNEMNDGVGPFALASQGYNTLSTEQTVQISDTQMLGTKIVNETRFQYLDQNTNNLAQSPSPAVNVLGAFLGGGNGIGMIDDLQHHYELQNYTSIAMSKNNLKFGGRLRVLQDANNSRASFNGNFTFASLTAYQITEQGIANGLTPAEILAAGGGASQFSIITGSPLANVTLVDAGLFVQDDYRVRQNLSLSFGLRFESQNNISDHADWAPRLGIAWGIGRRKSAPKTVLRAGYGFFYDRFTSDLVLQAERLNGITQQQLIVTAPDFFPPNAPTPAQLIGATSVPTVYALSPNLRAPVNMQGAVTLERQVSKIANVSVTYINSRGVHGLLTRNINAPLPSGDRPDPTEGNIYQYESDGVFRQNQMIASGNVRAGTRLTLFGYYTLNYAKADSNGAGSFPMNQYNLAEDYGRAAYDIRNRAFVGGTIGLPHGFRLSPFVVATSGAPFNIVIGQDLNGSSIFNNRPAFASPLSDPANVVVTKYGTFDTVPEPGETIIPINYSNGPAHFTFNLRASKTFGFGKSTKAQAAGGGGGGRGGGGPGGGGPGGGGGGRGGGPPMGGMGGMMGGGGGTGQRYNLTFSVSARNLFNNVNLAAPVGTLARPCSANRTRSPAGRFPARPPIGKST